LSGLCVEIRVPLLSTMKLSKRGEYALRALIDFGIAHELGRPLLKVGEIVEGGTAAGEIS